MARALVGVAVVVLFVLFFLAAPAGASHVQCGQTITADTTLDGDLLCSGNGLTIAAAGVTLDLKNHSIRGPGSTGIGVSVTADRARIRNGAIRGFDSGVETDGTRGTWLRDTVLAFNDAGLHCQYAPECRIEDSILRRNGTGIEVQSADNGSPEPTIVSRNSIRSNGIGVSITGEAAIVAGNRIHGNLLYGIRNDYGRPVEIHGNVISGGGGDGVSIEYIAYATVYANTIVRNDENGVAVHGSSGGFGDTTAEVTNNRIARNGADGVLAEGQGIDAIVARNDTRRNADDGIDVDFGGYTPICCFQITVQANRAFSNDDLGIEAAPGITDGGGNRARRNGNPAQCIGVTCD